MLQLPRLLVARVAARWSFSSAAVRHFSHRPDSPPEQFLPRRRFSIPNVQNPGLRVHAVSIKSGDYSDDDSDDDESKFDSYAANYDHENEDDDDDDDDFDIDDFDDDDNIDPDKAAYANVLREIEAETEEKMAKWTGKPPPHPTVIDDLGRSYGRGGRKKASARVYIQPGHGVVMINRMPLIQYFIRQTHRNTVLEPFVATNTCGAFDLQVTVQGGGLSGQAGAARHGLARALNAYHADLYRPALKKLGYLTRDPRKVERKKAGLKKARKAPQWVKR